MEPPRTAVAHEWLTTFGGSEQVAALLASITEATDIYTFTAREHLASELFEQQAVHTTRLGQRAFAQQRWQWLLPMMPAAWRQFDTSAADLVVSSSHCCVNSLPAHPHQIRVSYCHSPMRYAWYWREELARLPAPLRPIWPAIAGSFRRHDKAWSDSVDVYVANSNFTAARIRNAFGRSAEVVCPPIDTVYWSPDPSIEREDFLLVAGRLVAYKHPELVIKAANATGRRVVVAGDGPLLPQLQALAGPTVEFVIAPTRDELRDLYRRASAIVYPQIEEFGMTLVEAAACGTPALARGAGGAVETVIDGTTGLLFDHDGLEATMREFEQSMFDAPTVAALAQRFSRVEFERSMRAVLADSIERLSPRHDRDEWAERILHAPADA